MGGGGELGRYSGGLVGISVEWRHLSVVIPGPERSEGARNP
jgi:hypothetical protein